MMKTTNIFDTTIIDLAAAILTEIPDTQIITIDREHKVNGKDVIKIEYPEDQAEALRKIRRDFEDRLLLISLYEFNTNRRLVLNKLFGNRGRWNDNGKRNGYDRSQVR